MKLNIKNMKCAGCVTTVTETLRALTDSKSIEVNLETATAKVNEPHEINNPEAVIAALAEKGFPASII